MYFDTCFLFLKNRKRLFWKFTFSIHIPTETLCDLLRMILTMNNCTFNQQHYLQIHGTAMGTKMAPSFAKLFLCMFELHALTNAAWQPHIWWRYIDDISWSGQKVQIVRKYSAIISITLIPLLSLLALTHFNTNDLIGLPLWTKLCHLSMHYQWSKKLYFFPTGETRSITSHITCNTKNVNYMVRCNRCTPVVIYNHWYRWN